MKRKLNILTPLLAAIAMLLAALPAEAATLRLGAAMTEEYIPLLKGKRTGLLSNHTGIVDGRHTFDIMLDNGVNVTTLFSPEHGFRGKADAGQHVKGGADPLTGLPIVSLYTGGATGLAAALDSLDAVVIDLQDVGTRFYTYYITMLRVIEAAAHAGKEVIVLDRPNPIGMIVDGPVLDMKLRSGVGRLPIPVAHGMTLGELALMAVGEGWLDTPVKPRLRVVRMEGYTHATRYELPVPPSPNLRDMTAIYLYPSLCYFEGTPVSVGRGTDMPFKVYGHPDMTARGFTFTPRSVEGAKNPPLLGKLCQGVDLRAADADSLIARGIDLSYIIDARNNMPAAARGKFFTPFFDKLIGNTEVRDMIELGASADEVKASWADEVNEFKRLRDRYLLYPLQ